MEEERGRKRETRGVGAGGHRWILGALHSIHGSLCSRHHTGHINQGAKRWIRLQEGLMDYRPAGIPWCSTDDTFNSDDRLQITVLACTVLRDFVSKFVLTLWVLN